MISRFTMLFFFGLVQQSEVLLQNFEKKIWLLRLTNRFRNNILFRKAIKYKHSVN